MTGVSEVCSKVTLLRLLFTIYLLQITTSTSSSEQCTTECFRGLCNDSATFEDKDVIQKLFPDFFHSPERRGVRELYLNVNSSNCLLVN